MQVSTCDFCCNCSSFAKYLLHCKGMDWQSGQGMQFSYSVSTLFQLLWYILVKDDEWRESRNICTPPNALCLHPLLAWCRFTFVLAVVGREIGSALGKSPAFVALHLGKGLCQRKGWILFIPEKYSTGDLFTVDITVAQAGGLQKCVAKFLFIDVPALWATHHNWEIKTQKQLGWSAGNMLVCRCSK